MGLNLSAFAKLGELENMRAEVGGIERRYADLASIVVEAGFLERVSSDHEHMTIPAPAGTEPQEHDDEPSDGVGGGISVLSVE